MEHLYGAGYYDFKLAHRYPVSQAKLKQVTHV